MGAWGTAISDNDTFLDVHAGFFGLYDKGMDLGEITDRLKGEYRDLIKNEEEPDAHAFWFAIAQAQWECKGLQAEVLEQVKRIIETGKIWKPGMSRTVPGARSRWGGSSR